MKLRKILTTIYINAFWLLNIIPLKATDIFHIDDPLASQTVEVNEATQGALNNLVSFAMISINGLAGVGLFTSVLAFAINAFKFSKANGKERADAIEHMITIAITTACLGSVPFLMYVMSLLIGM